MTPWPLAATVAALIATTAAAQPATLVVSVAASVHDALAEVAERYKATTGITIALNAGGSNTLARQIVEGARAAVFVSADDRQMDVVENAGRIVPGTRTRLLTNELAVVAPRDASADMTLARVLEGRISRLAMGEPSAVPAGVYGRRWLEHEGAWARVSSRVVPFPTVRAVLAAVEAGRADAGIVYVTDAMSAKVQVVSRIAAKQHPYLDIVLPAAVVRGPAEQEGRRFLEFLKGPVAREIFARRGFGVER